ncbi:DUF554 domain-containing protein [Phormidesmis priestleyi ULC007]|uniref:DUF554 domain-containing protein n=1 Tax=Phormidesmis priestleyi ULC007 TaxID=1920490 RepID=A0A2T1D4Y4_9CYAN|nr:DUF554 domain-containing protein [Phormidesmis priestleyi ULC007]PZO46170.1 MAG: DUF554 domain-containing protein [Phormidesmis priestleyi]
MFPLTHLLIHPAALTLWDKTSGTWINVATILGGTLIGLVLTESLPDRMQRIITQGLGLLTLFLGVTLAGSLLKVKAGQIDGVIIGLLAIVLGGLLGEWWRIETQLQKVGNWLRDLVKGGGNFTEGFVAASLLFCIGPLAILGSLNNGLSGDHALLSIKSAMDGLASIALSSSYGIGVGFSSIAILLYQGGLSLCAGFLAQVLPDPANAPQVLLTSGVGGLMIMGLGLNLLKITQLSIAAFLPALLLAPVFCTIAQRLG